MIVYDNTNPKGRDLGPRKFPHGNEVSLLARLDVARPMPDGASWRDTTRAWLQSKPTYHPATVSYQLQCERCNTTFTATHRKRARFCGDTCRQANYRALRRTQGD